MLQDIGLGYFVYYPEPNIDHPADRSVSPPLRCRQPGYYDVDPPGYSDVDAPGYSDVDSPEETRFELASSMDIIPRAPFAGSFALWCGITMNLAKRKLGLNVHCNLLGCDDLSNMSSWHKYVLLKDGLAAIEKAETSKRIVELTSYKRVTAEIKALGTERTKLSSKRLDNDRFKVVALFTVNGSRSTKAEGCGYKMSDQLKVFSSSLTKGVIFSVNFFPSAKLLGLFQFSLCLMLLRFLVGKEPFGEQTSLYGLVNYWALKTKAYDTHRNASILTVLTFSYRLVPMLTVVVLAVTRPRLYCKIGNASSRGKTTFWCLLLMVAPKVDDVAKLENQDRNDVRHKYILGNMT
ncbi:hypothetical protein Tco_0333270 [Tanacetum coccineum]